jgi:hypothetical protein
MKLLRSKNIPLVAKQGADPKALGQQIASNPVVFLQTSVAHNDIPQTFMPALIDSIPERSAGP